MACDCRSDGYIAYSGMGQIDVGALTGVFSNAKDMWDNLVKSLGIGAGRREADVITPIQNRLVSDVIVPVSAYLDNVVNKGMELDCSALRNWIAEVNAAERQWLNYLHLTQWQDGRAAQQAEDGLAPYFNNAKTTMQGLISKDCSTVGGDIAGSIGNVVNDIITTPSGGMNWPVIAMGAGALYFLMRRK